MTYFQKLERRCGWLAFPGLLRYFAIFNLVVYMLCLMKPEIASRLVLNRDKVMEGEVWRLLTGLFVTSGSGWSVWVALTFKFIEMLIVFMISDALESAWGVMKTTLFCYAGILGCLAGCFLAPAGALSIGMFFFASAFFAFATVFPRVEFQLFFVIPVQVRFLAWLGAAGFILMALGQWAWWLVMVPAFSNYFLWAGIPALLGKNREFKAIGRRRQFEAAKMAHGETLHRCLVCDRTEQSDPNLEFRVGKDGMDYCVDHLPND